MATSLEYIEFVCDQLREFAHVRYQKMFGEYMVYVNSKPILLVCDNTVFVKKLECIAEKMRGAPSGFPYSGAKEHYILDIDDSDFASEIIHILETVTPLPKPKKMK
jgi:TfoX/Sxy family transcriptional regulator of competence genes